MNKNQIDAEKVRVEPVWISVKNKMPHRNDMVIGWSPELEKEGYHSYNFMYHENGTWKYYDDSSEVEIEITHWFDPCVLEFITPVSPKSDDKEVEKEEDEYLIYLKNSVYLGAGYLRQSEWFNPADILEQDMKNFLVKTFNPMLKKINSLKSELHNLKANYVLQEPVREQKLEKEITQSPDCESSVIKQDKFELPYPAYHFCEDHLEDESWSQHGCPVCESDKCDKELIQWHSEALRLRDEIRVIRALAREQCSYSSIEKIAREALSPMGIKSECK